MNSQQYADLNEGVARDLVRFADVEEALRDTRRLAWLLPVIDGSGDPVTTARRIRALGAGLKVNLTGNALVDYAMEGCPE